MSSPSSTPRSACHLLDRLEAKISEAEASYVAIGRFQVGGFRDMATFERHACGSTCPESRRVARRRCRHGDADPRTLEARGRADDLIEGFDRAA